MRRATFYLAPLLALQFSGTAHAGPPEQLVQLAMHPTDAAVMVVRYMNGGGGAFVTADSGKSWRLLCNSLLFDPVSVRGGTLVVTNDGTTIVGTFSGMWHDDGHACGWTGEPTYDGQWISDFTVDPIDSTITYAVTSSGGELNGILRRSAVGVWSDFGSKANLIITDVRVVPYNGGRRVYLGVVTGEIITDAGKPESVYAIRVSDDDGKTWTEHAFGASDGTLHVQAVDPTNPNRLVISIERRGDGGVAPDAAKDNVMVSGDQGKTFANYLTLTEIGGVAFTPNGRVYIGDAGNEIDPSQPRGLWSSPSLDVPATKLANGDYPVQCLGYRKATDTLYACGRTTFGAVDATDGSFTTLLDVHDVGRFVQCPGVDMAATCETQLCGAYCGRGHFAEAPVCCVYNTLTCGPAIAPTAICPVPSDAGKESGPDGGERDAGGADAASTGGNGGTGDASPSGGGGALGDSGGTHGAAASGNGSGDHEGGCCSVAGRSRSDRHSADAFAALVVAALVVRRRRR